jgi:hypothetical protein
VFVGHVPDGGSGGESTRIELETFLAHGREHRELFRLIGTLVEHCTGAIGRSAGEQGSVAAMRYPYLAAMVPAWR